jgi:dTDP-4-amino-4,6-dideoxy-D-galactose acyltransferase
MSNPPCILLDWDTTFFSFPVGRAISDTLTLELAKEIDEFCFVNNIRCLYLLARSDDPETIHIAENFGYNLVDIRVEFVHADSSSNFKSFNRADHRIQLREACSGDLKAFRRIAGSSYQGTRFYFDRRFPSELSSALYQEWITKSCSGYADRVFTAEIDNLPEGYITCHLGELRNSGRIGLVGVSKIARGKGVGSTLVRGALDWFDSINIKSVKVVTQGRNNAAQRLFQNCGFRTDSVNLWYHKWFCNSDDE